MWSEPRRAHPAGVIIYSAKLFRFVAALVLAMVPTIGLAGEVRIGLVIALAAGAVALAIAGSIAVAWAKWLTFTFRIEDRALRVDQGLLIRKSTRLTPERIQSIDTRANLLFRLVGLVTVDVHTAGRKQTPEVSIPALTKEEAEELSAELRPHAAASPDYAPSAEAAHEDAPGGWPAGSQCGAFSPAPGGERVEHVRGGVAWSLSAHEILLFAATSSAGFLAVAAGMTVAVPLVLSVPPVAEAIQSGSPVLLAVAGGFIALLILLGWGAGTMAAAFAHWGFTTQRVGEAVRIERGLLRHVTRSISLGRIQAVRLIQGPLRQLMGRVTIGIDAAGVPGTGRRETGLTVVHPLLLRDDVHEFVDLVIPGHRADAMRNALRRLPAAARSRYVIRAAFAPLLVAVPVSVFVPWGWIALAVPVAAAGWGLLAHSDGGWAVYDDVLALRYRRVARTTVLIRRQHIQSITVGRHPLQRIANLGTLVVQVASSPLPATFRLAHLPFRDAIFLLEWVAEGVEHADA